MNSIEKALHNVAEAAESLAAHGYNGYDTDSAALDVVFLRSLYGLRSALRGEDPDVAKYDPEGTLYDELPGSEYF